MTGTSPMNMGDANATPAYEVDGADLIEGRFARLASAPSGYGSITGTAYLARHGGDVGDGAHSVVVHPVRSTSAKVACAEFGS